MPMCQITSDVIGSADADNQRAEKGHYFYGAAGQAR